MRQSVTVGRQEVIVYVMVVYTVDVVSGGVSVVEIVY
jgi:hypothetical protein